MVEWCLKFKVKSRCSTSRARASVMTLSHGEVKTPVFMPVGTQGTMKGITVEQLKKMDFEIILANTYTKDCVILEKKRLHALSKALMGHKLAQ